MRWIYACYQFSSTCCSDRPSISRKVLFSDLFSVCLHSFSVYFDRIPNAPRSGNFCLDDDVFYAIDKSFLAYLKTQFATSKPAEQSASALLSLIYNLRDVFRVISFYVFPKFPSGITFKCYQLQSTLRSMIEDAQNPRLSIRVELPAFETLCQSLLPDDTQKIVGLFCYKTCCEFLFSLKTFHQVCYPFHLSCVCASLFSFFFYFAICSQIYSSAMSLFVQSDNLSTMNASVCTSNIFELYKRFQDVCKRAKTSSVSWVFCRLFCRGMNKSSLQAFCDAVRANQHICSFCFELSRYTHMRVIYFIF